MANMAKEPKMAEIDIGELLSTKRIEKGLSEAVAASKTKLSADSIRLLEANQFAAIGTPVYVRGYLGIYANFLGLDAASLIQLYNTQHPATETEARPSVKTMTTRKKIKRHSKTVSVLLALATFFGLSYAYFGIEPLVFSIEKPKAPVSSEVLVEDESLSAIDTTIQAAQNAKNLAEDVLNGLPVAGNELSASQRKESEEAFFNKEQPATETGETAMMPALTLESTADLDDENSESPTPQANKIGQMSLDLQFDKECWLKVADKQGKTLASGTYNKKKHLSVIGKGPFVITTWRPEAIIATVLNGTPVDLKQYKIGKKTFQLK